MGIRESLLNTITSVSNSDFVRIVTSAGVSSKATVQNLFKGFETGLGAKSSLGASDYIRVVGSDDVSYKQLLSSFPTSGTNTSTTAGSTVDETLHNYIDALPNTAQMYTKSLNASGYGTRMVIIQKYTNGNYASALEWGYLDSQPIRYHRKNNGTWSVENLPTRAEMSDRLLELPPSNDFNAVPKTSGHISFYRWGSDTLNSPYTANAGASDTGVVTSFYSGANYGIQFGISSNREEEYIRKLGGGTWGSWVKLPTRAEVDALNSKTSVNVTAASNVVIDTNLSYKCGNVLFLNVKGHTTGNVANAKLFDFSAQVYPNNFTFGIPISDTAWTVNAIAYGYIGTTNITATIQSGKYFHISNAFICA